MQAKWALRSASADTTSAGRANEMETGSARKWEANAESGPPSLCPTFISYAYMHALSARPTVSRAACLSALLPLSRHRGAREGILSPSRDGDLQRSAHAPVRALHVPIGPSDRRTTDRRTDGPTGRQRRKYGNNGANGRAGSSEPAARKGATKEGNSRSNVVKGKLAATDK